jgi:hypothetical protein
MIRRWCVVVEIVLVGLEQEGAEERARASVSQLIGVSSSPDIPGRAGVMIWGRLASLNQPLATVGSCAILPLTVRGLDSNLRGQRQGGIEEPRHTR